MSLPYPYHRVTLTVRRLCHDLVTHAASTALLHIH
ncbi:MAG: hypothetical protein KatS3mg109_0227 [Pirellulaceae bacterium]|nr:MAG: hypothetical protein KatS3mg109_0227 [Pirellulaceae bacterium]